ncbi:TM2 domain-containing protein [Congregibacter variabilis]|uniref:TM2 domain-containing protein n=1 Tax=Congregibacter variabilis TaxID=3081200 RepID=A0ABZ0I8H4_9GAMM|nr:TM2 domain-containing protein [Congregibacter sp. IMCC43200]
MESHKPRRDADFSRAVLEELYRYPLKRREIAWILWALTGLVGGHRFYLDRPATALAMAVTAGGGLVWWIADFFFIPKMLRSFNDDQTARKHSGQPPRALSFMPPSRGMALPPRPDWIEKRSGRSRLSGDLIVLVLAGIGVGAISSNTGNFEPVIAIVALSAITLLGARWDALATTPILRNFDRWSHRLRLYYYVNDPGGPVTLFFRPILGLITAPFRKRARAEAWLYLQIGLWFTIIFTGMDVLEAITIDAQGLSIHPMDFLADVAVTLVSIYAFAAPIGAILTTYVLLERRDLIVWALSCITLAAIYFGTGL